MAFVDKSYKNSDEDGSSTPLANNAQQGGEQSQPVGSQADPNVPVSAPNTQTGQQDKPKSTNKKGPASSGMFTNIQNYVNKNKEHAKKMSDNSLDKIRESSDRLKDEKSKALSQFTDRSNQDGMTDTQARLDEFNQYVNKEANQDYVKTQPPVEVPESPQTPIEAESPPIDAPEVPVSIAFVSPN